MSDHLLIGQFAFAHNKQLTSFKAGKGLVSIGDNAIYGNDILTDIELNEGLQTIDQNAFGQCFELKTLTIPSTVTSIGNTIFIQDDALETIVNKAADPQVLAGSLFLDDSSYEKVKLIVPAASVEAYRAAEYWKNFAVIESDEVISITDLDASEPTVIESYGIDGVRSSLNSRGLRIVRMSDGTVRKEYIR